MLQLSPAIKWCVYTGCVCPVALTPDGTQTSGMSKKEDILIRFGRACRRLRLAAGFSQEKFANHAEIDRSWYGGVERGERNITLRNIERIADKLGVSVGEMFAAVDQEGRSRPRKRKQKKTRKKAK